MVTGFPKVWPTADMLMSPLCRLVLSARLEVITLMTLTHACSIRIDQFSKAILSVLMDIGIISFCTTPGRIGVALHLCSLPFL